MRQRDIVLPLALLSGGVGALAGFAVLARRVKAHESRETDARARKRFPKRRRPATRVAAAAIAQFGKWYGQAPSAALVAAKVWRARGPRAAAPIAAASATAAALGWALERTLRHRRPPPGRHAPTSPSFPSGHALRTSAIAWTCAYVLAREGMATPQGVIPLALAIPAAAGLAKLYMDRHWFTDVAGGYLLGAAIAAGAAASHELIRPRRVSRIARVRAWMAR